MQRFNSLRLKLVDRLNFLENEIARLYGEGYIHEGFKAVCQYEETAKILKMADEVSRENAVAKKRHLRVV